MEDMMALKEYYENYCKNLQKVNFYEAQKNPNYFEYSGLELINNFLSDNLKNTIYSFYVDLSTILSSIEDKKLIDYILINNMGGFLNINSIQDYYHPLYIKLKNDNIGLYYENEFFIEPKEPYFYCSNEFNKKDASLVIKKNEIIKLIEKATNIYYLRNELEIDYSTFRQNANKHTFEEIKENNKIFHSYLNNYFINNEPSCSYLLSIPLIGAPTSMNNSFNGQGAIFVFILCDKKIDDDLLTLAQNLGVILKDITFNYLFQVGHNLAEKAKKASLKSAIAAIMARNMSHNLGSHVFFYVREEIIREAERLMAKEDKDIPLVSVHKGLAKFLYYVQERQDFVATITSQDEYFFGPLNIKQDVLDELTPDAVDVRHNSEPPSTNFLLKYLVNSEYIERKPPSIESKGLHKDIEIKINFDGKEFQSKPGNPKGSIATDFYDINVAVQGGQQSRHAFLIIIENIIRNAAKHGFDRTLHNNLELEIKVEKVYSHYLISITDNCRNGETAEKIINKQLNNLRILGSNDSQPIDRESKGLKEIIVCVAWLKRKPISEIFSHEKGICEDLISVKSVNDNLCYQFTLEKFEPTQNINNGDIETLKKGHDFKKYGYIYTCSEDLIVIAQKYFPRAINKLGGRIEVDYWKKLAIKKYGSNNLPVIIFERESSNEKNKSIEEENLANNSDSNDNTKFIFVKGEPELKQKILEIGNRDYILFKNHLAKNDDSLRIFYENEDRIWNKHKPLVLESISGANYSFNLFQLARIEKNQDKLYYRIIESYFSRIAIIDERLCPVKSPLVDDLDNLTIDNINSFVDVYISDDSDEYTKQILDILESNETKDEKKKKLYEWWKGVNNDHKSIIKQEDQSKNKYQYQKDRKIFLFTMDKLGTIFDITGQSHQTLELERPHFLSIHISLIDKYHVGDKNMSTLEKLMRLVNDLKVESNCYIALHSGRGGLTDKNQNITFIPFANLQWALENSKFMLSELFYNQIYYPLT